MTFFDWFGGWNRVFYNFSQWGALWETFSPRKKTSGCLNSETNSSPQKNSGTGRNGPFFRGHVRFPGGLRDSTLLHCNCLGPLSDSDFQQAATKCDGNQAPDKPCP